MKKLIGYGSKYIKQMTVIDVGLLKICLCAMGIIIGLCTPQKHREKVAVIASFMFAMTYVPVMGSFIHFVTKTRKSELADVIASYNHI